MLSIGTGEDADRSLLGGLKNLVECLASLATQTEQTDQQFQESNSTMVDGGRFYRFNVPGLGNVGLEEYEALDVIAEKTDAYLDKVPIYKQVSACVNKMIAGGRRVVPADIQGTQHANDPLISVELN